MFNWDIWAYEQLSEEEKNVIKMHGSIVKKTSQRNRSQKERRGIQEKVY